MGGSPLFACLAADRMAVSSRLMEGWEHAGCCARLGGFPPPACLAADRIEVSSRLMAGWERSGCCARLGGLPPPACLAAERMEVSFRLMEGCSSCQTLEACVLETGTPEELPFAAARLGRC